MSKDNYKPTLILLNKEDHAFLQSEGYTMSAKIRKIVADWVAYKKVSRNNPMKDLPGDIQQ